MTWPRVSLRTRSRVIVGLLLLAGPLPAYSQIPAAGARGPAAQAPATNAPGVRQSLDRLNVLVQRVPNASIGVNFATFRLRVALDQLRRLAGNWPAESPADYRLNMDRNVRLMEQALAASPPQMQSILEAIADDLEVKLEHCNNSGGKLGGSVEVTVRTVQGSQEVRNWQVFYVPRVLDVIGGATPDRFPRLSSPTLETLVPGRYVMWARDPEGGRTGEKTVVKVGEGRKDLQLDLLVPAGTQK
jgi:hypothetical protein